MYKDDTKSCTCLADPPTSYHLKPSSAFENHPVLNLSVTKKQQIIFQRLICMLFCLHEIVTEDVQSRRNLRAQATPHTHYRVKKREGSRVLYAPCYPSQLVSI